MILTGSMAKTKERGSKTSAKSQAVARAQAQGHPVSVALVQLGETLRVFLKGVFSLGTTITVGASVSIVTLGMYWLTPLTARNPTAVFAAASGFAEALLGNAVLAASGWLFSAVVLLVFFAYAMLARRRAAQQADLIGDLQSELDSRRISLRETARLEQYPAKVREEFDESKDESKDEEPDDGDD